MSKRTLKAILMALLLPALSLAEEGDWGYAHNNYIVASLGGKWSLLHRSQVAMRDNMSDLFFGFADIGVGYKFLPDWRLDGVYRRAWIRPGEKWLIEDRKMADRGPSADQPHLVRTDSGCPDFQPQPHRVPRIPLGQDG